jgi:hypothetical protein
VSTYDAGAEGEDELRLPGPLSFSGLVASSWRSYISLFGRLLIVGFVCFAIADLIEIAVLSVTPLSREASLFGSLRFLFPLSMYVLLGSFMTALVSVAVADGTAGLSVSVGTMWRGVRAVFKEVIASNLLAVVVALSLVVLLAAFPFLFLPLFFGPPLVVHAVTLERKRLQEGVPRMRALARGNWGRTILYLLSVALGARLLQGAVLDGMWSLTASLVTVLRAIVFVFSRVLIEAATASFVAVVGTFLYFDLRARLEDYGPEELRAERARANPDGPPA